MDDYQGALKADPERHAVGLQATILFTRLGEFDKAIPLLEAFIRIAPESRFAKELGVARRLLECLNRETGR